MQTVLPSFHSGYLQSTTPPACTVDLSKASVWSLSSSASLMPPQPPIISDRNRIPNLSATCQYGHAMLSEWLLLLLVVVIGLRLAVIKYSSGKRRTPDSKIDASITEKYCLPYQEAPQPDMHSNASTGSQVQQTVVFKPTYPWTSPPQPLPGPYDPRLYPLPTIRRHSFNPSVEQSHDVAAASYTRRVSLNSLPSENGTLRGTVTVSSQGWRRNQWIISGE
ncbi:hypothetical protein DPSP01_013899 [Paraphaeosphaeria sporulosa]|uniref:Uncharacterized protein n=1 Tax=Paraphaeosphaeria sporulosa TaxID=1460663 RepID=A0A177C651_9PLEO|nr:uncharacterized protein CC84DRAFT_936917 [Paraphaeosphaeria sporulosa]OAG02886.1 hypothetical protein CC84DRAFT_936917 [Paraphaeosphaeria sporulosa]